MPLSTTIRKGIACLLFLLAVLGATPRQYLHHLFADHQDTDYGFRGKERALASTVYHCGFYHQVTTSPVVPEPAFLPPAPCIRFFARLFVPLRATPHSGYAIASDGRGPPASAHLS